MLELEREGKTEFTRSGSWLGHDPDRKVRGDWQMRFHFLAPQRAESTSPGRSAIPPRRRAEPEDLAVDVFDEGAEIYVIAVLPGISEDEIGIRVNGRHLVLQGGRGDWSYYKEVSLPAAVDGARVQTKLRHGVLEVRLPKLEERGIE
jgi:HSP20 family molecular chaperone IbpA